MMAKAKPIKTGNSGRKLVLMMLADIADDNGRCFPSYQHVADVCEMSRRSVMRYVNDLVDQGLLKIEQRRNGKLNQSNIYTLDLKVVTESHHPSDTQSLPSDTQSPGGSDTQSPITYHSIEPINEPIKTKAKKGLSLDGLPDIIDQELLSDYIEMRKSIKAPMTQKALTILVNKIQKLAAEGQDANSLLETAILNNWKSVYPERGNPIGGNQQGFKNDHSFGGNNHDQAYQQPYRQTRGDQQRDAANRLVASLGQAH
jgi:biotin operon repressor